MSLDPDCSSIITPLDTIPVADRSRLNPRIMNHCISVVTILI